MAKLYYLATNIWGCGRALETGNGWGIEAYTSKEERDRMYDKLDYIDTGVMIPSVRDMANILECEPNEIGYGPEIAPGIYEVGVIGR